MARNAREWRVTWPDGPVEKLHMPRAVGQLVVRRHLRTLYKMKRLPNWTLIVPIRRDHPKKRKG